MAGGVCAGVFSLVLLLAAGVFAFIQHGPVHIDFLRERVVQELMTALGGRHRIAFDGIQLGMVDGMPAAHLEGMQVRDSEGRVVMSTPAASISFDPSSLLGLRLAPTALAIAKLDLRLDIHPDGSLAIAAGENAAEPEKPAQAVLPPPAVSGEKSGGGDLPASGKAVVSAISELEQAFADNGLLAQLQAVNITDGRLVVRHLATGQDIVFSHVQVTASSDGSDSRRIALTGTGPRGPLTVSVTSKRSEKDYRNGVTVRGLTLSDLATVAGITPGSNESDPQVALALDTVLDAAKTRADVKGAVEIGALKFSTDGTPDGLISLDKATLEFGWNSDSGAFDIRSLRAASGESRIDLAGMVSPIAGQPGKFQIGLKSNNMLLDSLTTKDQPLAKLALAISGSVDTRDKVLDLSSLTLEAPDYRVAAQIHAAETPDGPEVAWKLDAANVPVRAALRIWPSIFVSDARRYLTENLSAGTLRSISIATNMPAKVFRDSLEHKPIPEDALHGEYVISDASITPVDTLPPIQQTEITGSFTARTNTVNILRGTLDLGNNRRLFVSEGRFYVADTARKPADAKIAFRIQGAADAAQDLASRPPIVPENGQFIDPSQVKGTVDMRATIAMPLIPKPKKSDIVSTLSGTISNLSIEKAFGNERLEAANLQVNTEKHVTVAKGEGKLFGANASLTMRQAAGEAGEVQVQFTADDAARAKRGLATVAGLKGPVGVTAKTAVQKTGLNDTAAITLDLTKASIDGVVPGWTKPAGKPAKVSFNYQSIAGGGSKLENIVLDGGPVQAKGSLVLEEDGGVRSGRFESFKLSASDSLKIDIDKTSVGIRTTIRGNTLDARPFLRETADSAKPLDTRPSKEKDHEKEVDIDLKVAILSGFNGEAMSNAELRLVNAGPDIRQFNLVGRLNGEPVTGKLNKPVAQGGAINIATTDAGAFLRFVDIYPRMSGGRLDLNLVGPATRQVGTMAIRDFSLHNEPAMRSMASRLPPGGSPRDGDVTNSTGALPLDGDVAFTKLRAEFVREPSRITFNDAVMWGPQVGGSVNGFIDYGRDRVNLTGSFVPAYQLNNAFAQVPVLGGLLGGGKNEGLFAVSFQIAGKVTAPVLHVSPLSAIAPGFLRKIFEFRQQGARADVISPEETTR